MTGRWVLRGTLTLLTPLHVGSGRTEAGLRIRREDDPETKQGAEVSAVARDHADQPYIPGSSLKGVLRSWLTRMSAGDMDAIERVFGRQAVKDDSGFGGVAEFADCFLDVRPGTVTLPHAQGGRATAVMAGVSIARETGAAAPRLLAHRSVVPPGSRFTVVVTGDDADIDDMAYIAAALEGFNHAGTPLSLGRGGGHGDGRATWTLTSFARVPDDPQELLALLDQGVWSEGVLIDAQDLLARKLADIRPTLRPGGRIGVELRLTFDGPVLVNDPSIVRGPRQPIRFAEGRYVLPGSSLRGVLRARAERILRTLVGQETLPQAHAALIDHIFGATSRKGRLTVDTFELAGPVERPRFEMIAIDRFTGGGADGRKFATEPLWRPAFAGRLALDLDGVSPAAIGLLVLVFRDLAEGDISIGSGAAKGYGACRIDATRTRWQVHPPNPTHPLAELLAKLEGALAGDGGAVRQGAVADTLRTCVGALRALPLGEEDADVGPA